MIVNDSFSFRKLKGAIKGPHINRARAKHVDGPLYPSSVCIYEGLCATKCMHCLPVEDNAETKSAHII